MWADLAYRAQITDEGPIADRNRAARFAVLWALQYDRRPEDLPLLRFLLQQQTTYYREAVPWGLAPDLTLAGFLVAEHRQVEDLWLHWDAKNISFDTALGYHLYHLFTPGITAASETVRSSSHPDRERILRDITSARHTDAAIEEWLDQQRARFPSDPADEGLKSWAQHAARLGEREASRLFLTEWAAGEPRTDATLNTLQFHLAQLGYLAEAVEVQKEAITISELFQRCRSRVRTARAIADIRFGLHRALRKIRQDFRRATPRSTGARAAESARLTVRWVGDRSPPGGRLTGVVTHGPAPR